MAPTSCITRRPSSCGGHGIAIGGVLVDGGTVRLGRRPANFPSSPSPTKAFTAWCSPRNRTVAPFLLRARREGLRDFGACMAPMTAFQILQGIETLPLRMERHVENTRKVVAFLARAPGGRARAPIRNSPAHPDHALAQAPLPRGCGAVFSFDLQGDARGRAQASSKRSALFSHLANVGDAKSLVIHPAITTHFRMDDAALAAAGIAGHDPPVDRPRRSRRPDRRPRARAQRVAEDLMQPPCSSHGLEVTQPTRTPAATRFDPSAAHGRVRARRRARPQRVGTANAATSRTTASTCSPSTCPGTAAAPARPRAASGAWPTGSSRCSTRAASSSAHRRRPQHGLADRARLRRAAIRRASTHLALLATAVPMTVSDALARRRARSRARRHRHGQPVVALDDRRKALVPRARASGCTA